MTKLEVSFAVGNKTVDAVNIKTVSFTQYAAFVAGAYAMRLPSTYEGRLRRLRMERQVEYLFAGKAVALTLEEILKIPIAAALKISRNLDTDEDASSGKIIREGDGISTAIGYELGTPIEIAQGKEPIKELEFLASTYGDIEDVLSATDGFAQTIALIRTVAKPVHASLSTLPTWAVDRISIADGVTIAQNVTSRFLDDGEKDG